jgi:two-component system, OmpR family, response regulator
MSGGSGKLLRMNILLAEDDEILADALQAHLSQAGFAVEHAPNGAVADYLLHRHAFDLVVLDIGLPMMDGLSVLQKLRRTQPDLPVLILSARDALDDRVQGLQCGADDYLTKPFDVPELVARLHALLRRQRASHLLQANVWLGLRIEDEKHRAYVHDAPLELSGREWELLNLLVEKRDQVVSKEAIHKAWQQEGGDTTLGNAIEVYIHRLRKKIEGSGLQIRTIRGLGYLMESVE